MTPFMTPIANYDPYGSYEPECPLMSPMAPYDPYDPLMTPMAPKTPIASMTPSDPLWPPMAPTTTKPPMSLMPLRPRMTQHDVYDPICPLLWPLWHPMTLYDPSK